MYNQRKPPLSNQPIIVKMERNYTEEPKLANYIGPDFIQIDQTCSGEPIILACPECSNPMKMRYDFADLGAKNASRFCYDLKWGVELVGRVYACNKRCTFIRTTSPRFSQLLGSSHHNNFVFTRKCAFTDDFIQDFISSINSTSNINAFVKKIHSNYIESYHQRCLAYEQDCILWKKKHPSFVPETCERYKSPSNIHHLLKTLYLRLYAERIDYHRYCQLSVIVRALKESPAIGPCLATDGVHKLAKKCKLAVGNVNKQYGTFSSLRIIMQNQKDK